MDFKDGKSADAFRTIREVSEHIGVPQHILRFWETRFPQLKPLQRGGNRRYYRPADVALASALHMLLHGQGYTVKGVQKLVAEHGAEGLVALANGKSMAAGPVTPQTIAASAAVSATVSAASQPAILRELRAMRDKLAAALAA